MMKENSKDAGAKSLLRLRKKIGGFLTHEEVRTVKLSTQRKSSESRKSTITKWLCNECRSSFYYMIHRCPACESDSVTKMKMSTNYRPSMTGLS